MSRRSVPVMASKHEINAAKALHVLHSPSTAFGQTFARQRRASNLCLACPVIPDLATLLSPYLTPHRPFPECTSAFALSAPVSERKLQPAELQGTVGNKTCPLFVQRQDVVAANEDLPKVAPEAAVNPLLQHSSQVKHVGVWAMTL